MNTQCDTAQHMVKTPSVQETLKVIASIEDRFRVDQWNVEGIPVWPLVRVRWRYAQWSETYTSTKNKGAQQASRIKQLMSALIAKRSKEKSGRTSDGNEKNIDTVFLSDNVSLAKISGNWIERYCDPLRRQLEEIGVTHHLFSPGHSVFKQRIYPNESIQRALDWADARAVIKFKLGNPNFSLPDHKEVIDFVSESGFSVGPMRANSILLDSLRLKMTSEMFQKILAIKRPRVAFCVGYYGILGMGFIHACDKLRIHSVDIQHGVQGYSHVAYANWTRLSKIKHPLLPDTFWVWNEWDREVIESWSRQTHHKVVLGGNPWLSIWRKENLMPQTFVEIEKVNEYRRKFPIKKTILFTLQFGLKESEQLDPIKNFVCRHAHEFNILVRLHPAMLHELEAIKQKFDHCLDESIEFASYTPLPALMMVVDFHITHSSSSVFEANEFGVPSIITSAYGSEVLKQATSNKSVSVEIRGWEKWADVLNSKNSQYSEERSNINTIKENIQVLFRRIQTLKGKA